MYTVYWIRHKDHTDAYSQGYVGISEHVQRRWKEHKTTPSNKHLMHAIQKYGWDNLIKQVIFTGSKEACLAFEEHLRPEDKIGWNLIKGGGLPPVLSGDSHHMKRPEVVAKFLGDNHPMKRLENAAKISGENHYLFGKNLSDKTKLKISITMSGKFGSDTNFFKGNIEVTNLQTGKKFVLAGKKEIIDAGFNHRCVYQCVNNKQKKHKGHTFMRIN